MATIQLEMTHPVTTITVKINYIHNHIQALMPLAKHICDIYSSPCCILLSKIGHAPHQYPAGFLTHSFLSPAILKIHLLEFIKNPLFWNFTTSDVQA